MSKYDHIYLSPHLDDAIYSCGGQMFQHTSGGSSVLIVTLMAGDPDPGILSSYAQSLHKRWELRSDAPNDRRVEDAKACQVVGADYLHWPYLDCIYRRDNGTGLAMYQSDEALFGAIDASESELIASVSAQIRKLPPHSMIFAPLSAGNHVDHQITYKAATLMIDPARISYYEEYPYVIDAADMIADHESDISWQSEVVPISQEALTAKIRAMLCYRSQISTFFESTLDLERRVTRYIETVGGERIWHRHIPGNVGSN